MSGPSPQEKLAAAQADQEKWSQIAADPNLSPRAAQWALGIALSAKAEVRLRQKGLAWQAEQNGKPEPARPAPASEPSRLSPEQWHKAWNAGIVLAALSLAQQESAEQEAPPEPTEAARRPVIASDSRKS